MKCTHTTISSETFHKSTHFNFFLHRGLQKWEKVYLKHIFSDKIFFAVKTCRAKHHAGICPKSKIEFGQIVTTKSYLDVVESLNSH